MGGVCHACKFVIEMAGPEAVIVGKRRCGRGKQFLYKFEFVEVINRDCALETVNFWHLVGQRF